MTRHEAFELVGRYFFNGKHKEDEAAEAGSLAACEGLGYIWYYGRLGEKDYEKAFYYFSMAAEEGNVNAGYKIADMYKNGYYVEKDYEKYKEIIEELYEEIRDENPWEYPISDVTSRLARIRKEEGNDREALALLVKAEELVRLNIRERQFWGDMHVMKWLKEDHYKWTAFDPESFGFYDLFYLLGEPVRVRFTYRGQEETVESVSEDGEIHIRFNDRWFRSIDDFFEKAEIGGEKLTRIEERFRDWRIV